MRSGDQMEELADPGTSAGEAESGLGVLSRSRDPHLLGQTFSFYV